MSSHFSKSKPANTNSPSTQAHKPEASTAEPRSTVRYKPKKQSPEQSRFLKYPLRYILPKPPKLPMAPGSPSSSQPGPVSQPSTARAEQIDTDDKTAPHPEQENWSITNLPDILYALRPGTENAKCRRRVHTNFGPVFGNLIRNLPILPDRISSHVEGWRLEAWMRLDRRITPQDIIDRVNPLFRVNITENEIEARRSLFRQAFHVAQWGNQKSMNEICRMVISIGRDPKLNSTRGVTPGLIVPAEGEAGGRIPLPPPPLVRNYPGPVPIFTMNDQAGPHMQPRPVLKPTFPGQYVFSFRARDEPTDSPGPRTPPRGRNQVLNEPEIKIETPPMPKLQFVDETSQVPVAQPPTPDTINRKRKADVHPADIFKQISRARRSRPHLGPIPSFPEYPHLSVELASHEGPPARFFPGPLEFEPHQEMSLEEYLEKNKLGYIDFLNARYFDDMRFPTYHGAGPWI